MEQMDQQVQVGWVMLKDANNAKKTNNPQAVKIKGWHIDTSVPYTNPKPNSNPTYPTNPTHQVTGSCVHLRYIPNLNIIVCVKN